MIPAKLSAFDGVRLGFGLTKKTLNPTAVDHVTLIGDGTAVIRSQEKNEPGDFFRQNHFLEGLVTKNLGLILFREPQLFLALREDRAGKHAVHANVVRP